VICHPFFRYALLGEFVGDGILAWATIGVDAGKDYEAQCGAECGEDGVKCVLSGGRPGGQVPVTPRV
jgi:hypothetical protein